MAQTLLRLIELLRYRFLVIAGLFPYMLGAALGFSAGKRFHPILFFMGFAVTLTVLIGVEALNEYCDWRIGSDRVFQVEPHPVTPRTLIVGIASFGVATFFAIQLASQRGGIMLSLFGLGVLAAVSYLTPPLKLSHRGWGEVVIAIAYGPLLVLAGSAVQTGRIDFRLLWIAVIPALQLFQIAIINEVPDYHQDKLVGKRNICVRMGKLNVLRLHGIITTLVAGSIFIGLLTGYLPVSAWFILLCSPLPFMGFPRAAVALDQPQSIIPVLRFTIIYYLITMSVLIIGYVV